MDIEKILNDNNKLLEYINNLIITVKNVDEVLQERLTKSSERIKDAEKSLHKYSRNLMKHSKELMEHEIQYFDILIKQKEILTKDYEVQSDFSSILIHENQNKRMFESLTTNIYLPEIIGMIMEHIDPYTKDHQRHVAKISFAIAEKLNLENNESKKIYFAALIHDIGKIIIPMQILAHPGHLEGGFKKIIQEHPGNAEKILKKMNSYEGWYEIINIITQHHEKLDGSGYPLGLKEDQIYFSSQIITVADIFDACLSDRPYRASLGIDMTLDLLQKEKDEGKLNANIVDTLIYIINQKKITSTDDNSLSKLRS